MSEFGTYGNGDGEFDCLAGVAINRIGQFIIADRYNHRIQVFDPAGMKNILFFSRSINNIENRISNFQDDFSEHSEAREHRTLSSTILGESQLTQWALFTFAIKKITEYRQVCADSRDEQ